jgi:quercetin dioxygenase-like cupin family protein
MTRWLLLSVLALTGFSSIAWSQAAQQSAAPPAVNPANFTGKVTPHPTVDIRTLRYSFDPGARTNWHSHEGGQVVLIEQGRARVQEAGAEVREFGAREVFTSAPGVKHWHGALPNQSLTQVALSFGATTWMESVTDAQYASGVRK